MPIYTKSENSNLIKKFMFFRNTLNVSNLSVSASVVKRSDYGLLDTCCLMDGPKVPNGWKSGNIYCRPG